VRSPGILRTPLAAALLLLVGLLVLPISTLATHRPTVEDVVAVATSEGFNMECSGTPSAVGCVANDFDGQWSEYADIRPGSGSLLGVGTQLDVHQIPPDSFFNSWHQALQGVACAPDRTTAGQLSSFVSTVMSRREEGTDGPITIADECTLSGGLRIASDGSVTQYTFWIQSAVLAPPETATPTPTRTPRPTPSPTAEPTGAATPTPALTPSGGETASASASVVGSASASPTGSALASETPTSSATATAEQSVLAGNPSPTPSAQPAGAPAGQPSTDRKSVV